MGQMLVRQLDDTAIVRLKAMAKDRRTSVEALAREAIHRAAAELSIEEKLAIVRRAQAITERAKVPGAIQTSAIELIREDRDR